ncbi:MBL fold metallo-hydrolase [Candidatus Woesebacteria bacterium]|nr:MBL fold metallo-hydrolase [Candidatus Woesebacteria bacterium]
MKIKFLGAAGTVTGSSYVVTSNSGQSILIDLGMFQGPTEIDKLNYENFDYDCARLSGAILTHAHLDHCGRIPILLPRGFKGDIWMTRPTKDLTELSLLDSAKIAKQDGKKVLFDKELATNTFTHFKSTDYHAPVELGDFKITMYDAGHILGSASLLIEVDGQKIIFSGDLGNSPQDLVNKTETFSAADIVVMESTYGDRVHPAGEPEVTIAEQINAAEASGGMVLIPAFSLDRTQEILHILLHLKKLGKIKNETPVYLDGPMAEKATAIYLNYPNSFNSHIQDDLKQGDPFTFPGLIEISTREQSQGIYQQPLPGVIIAGSGMMTGGRIVGHAAHYLPQNSTRLLIVGYQGEGTLGRQLLEGEKTVTIDDMQIAVRATVTSIETMSSHADQSQLLNWLKPIGGVKKIFLTHGEDGSRKVLSQKITSDLGIGDICLPTLNEEVII